ncbi:hypothetical protein SUDANB70_05268 [Streptomyces sp. enrichment culture]
MAAAAVTRRRLGTAGRRARRSAFVRCAGAGLAPSVASSVASSFFVRAGVRVLPSHGFGFVLVPVVVRISLAVFARGSSRPVVAHLCRPTRRARGPADRDDEAGERHSEKATRRPRLHRGRRHRPCTGSPGFPHGQGASRGTPACAGTPRTPRTPRETPSGNGPASRPAARRPEAGRWSAIGRPSTAALSRCPADRCGPRRGHRPPGPCGRPGRSSGRGPGRRRGPGGRGSGPVPSARRAVGPRGGGGARAG